MPDRVRITDVSPRDGLQNEAGVVPAACKARLIALLEAAGLDEIEATSFVSPRWVPQLGDSEEVLSRIRAYRSAASASASNPSPSGRGQGEGSSDHSLRRARTLDPRREPITERARELRSESSFPERLLWSRLRNRGLCGLKFRRQSPIGPYFADFYCESARLVVELDGVSHESSQAARHDRERDEAMKAHGLAVLRVHHDELLRDIDAVLVTIARAAGIDPRTRNPLTLPSPDGRGVARRHAPVLSVLVPNDKGFEKALAVHRARLPLKIAVFTAASETFSARNTNATIRETIERFAAFLPRAFEASMPVRMYISCAVACPFEGPIRPEAVARVAEMLRRLIPPGASAEIDLGDTIGVAHPLDIAALLAEFPPSERAAMTLHLHDTFGRAAACVREALAMGVRSFDGSVAGLGGCPYAGTREKPAPGNISTETLIDTVEAEGFETGIDLDALADAAEYAREIVMQARASAARAGAAP
jgi:hydroxymethylglutaryl-CoA lyase